MKTAFIIIIISLILPFTARAEQQPLAQKLSGRILLQVESYGRAWYVNPSDLARYYLRNGAEAYELMKRLGLGITNQDLAKIPQSKTEKPADTNLVRRLKGRILLQTEDSGQAWYVSPLDGVRYYLKDGEIAYQLMKQTGLGIKNKDLYKIPMNNLQIMFDPAINDPGYAKLTQGTFAIEHHGDTIMPLASLTKLMTALVITDLDPDWNAQIAIIEADITYPKKYYPKEATSEVGFKAWDIVTINDLFVALLVASSNQSAALLSRGTGITTQEFVTRMNQKARELGLKKPVFFEPAGLDPYNVSTPKEMAIISQAAFNNFKIAQTAAITDYTINAITNKGEARLIPVRNRNFSLLTFQPDASKTGFLTEEQRTGAFQKGDTIIVVLHARSMTERNAIIKKLLK